MRRTLTRGPGHDLQVDADRALLAVDVGNRLDLRERVADVAQRRGDRVGGVLEQLARERLAGLDQHQLAAGLPSGRIGVAGELDVGDRVDLAFGDAGGDVHVALVGADRDLGGVDAEIDVAAVQVVRVELLQVAGEFLARILVVASVPAEPVGFLDSQPSVMSFCCERLVADQVDVPDLRRPCLRRCGWRCRRGCGRA